MDGIRTTLAVVVLSVGLLPAAGWACACGCGVFDVGTGSMFPSGSGGRVFFMYNFVDQYTNWSGASKAPAIDNTDKVIRTSYFTLGLQYMFNRNWGVLAQVPFADRYVKMESEEEPSMGTEKASTTGIGDIRVEALYTGFSEDMSDGITVGMKFPSGDFSNPHFERDTQLGTGSTNVLLGAYHIGTLPLTYAGRAFNWYAQARWDVPLWTQDQYTPGNEINAAAGMLYSFETVGPFESISPVLGLIGTDRQRDHGANANPEKTGYDRLLIAPGIEFKFDAVRFYSDVEFPLYQDVVGNQVTAPVLVKTIVSYDF